MRKIKRQEIENVRHNLRTLTEPYGEKTRLAYAARIAPKTLQEVLNGTAEPSMNLFLTACDVYAIAPATMMKGPVDPSKATYKLCKTGAFTEREYEVAYPVIHEGKTQLETAKIFNVSRQYVQACVRKVKGHEDWRRACG